MRRPLHRWTIRATLSVVIAWTAGCALHSHDPAPSPRAAAFFEPVGPLRLMQHRPRPERAREPAATATFRTTRHRTAALVPDSKLRLDVGMALHASSLGLEAVDVAVHDQNVRLSGVAPSLEARDRAELLARSVTGVASVANEIRLESGGTPDGAKP